MMDSLMVSEVFLDLGPDLDVASAGSVLVVAAVGGASGREVRVDGEVLALQDAYRCIEKFVEVVREDLGCHSHCDAFRALREQEREAYRELGRLLVPAVVGGHPVCDLGIEYDFFGKFAESRLDVTRSGIAVSCEYVSPVSLAVDQKTLLSELHKGAKDTLVTVRMVLHRLTDDVRHLCVASVVHLVHCVQDTSLDRFQTIDDVRDGSRENDIGGIVQKPVLEHSGKLELPAVRFKKPFVLSCRNSVHHLFLLFFFTVLFRSTDVIPFFVCHINE